MISVASVIFDLVMLALIVLSVFIGKKTGLLRMALILGIVFFSVVIARVTMPLINTALEKLELGKSVKTAVSGRITEFIEEDADIDFEGVINKLDLPEFAAGMAEEQIAGIKEKRGAELADRISTFVAEKTVRLASYVIFALLMIVALLVIVLVTKVVEKLPVIGTFNEIGGAMAGLLTALVTVLLICLLVCGIGLGSEGLLGDISRKSLFIRLLNSIGVVGGVIK